MSTETHNYSPNTADVITTHPGGHLWLSLTPYADGITAFRSGQRFARTLSTPDVALSALVQGF